MSFVFSRRSLLLSLCAVPLALHSAKSQADALNMRDSVHQRLAALEQQAHGRLGVALLHHPETVLAEYRADERFPLCSTFKLVLVGGILKRCMIDAGLLQRDICITPQDILSYAPITAPHVGKSMTVSALCAAALQYSDNTAANLLMKILSGPQGLTEFARELGDTTFRIDRWEPALNDCTPHDERDTTSPAAMGRSCCKLLFGNSLGKAQRDQLHAWLLGNTTGAERIRAGVPTSWRVGDKTGSGEYGTTNDVAVLWPPQQQPLILAVYFTQFKQQAVLRSEVLAAATKIVCAAYV